MPGRFETSAQAADSFATLFVYGLVWITTRSTSNGSADGRGRAHAAARKYLAPERLLVVAVGDRQKIEVDLMKLNLGATEYRDAEGNVVVKP